MTKALSNILLNIDQLSPDRYEWRCNTEDGEEISGICSTFEDAMIAGDREISKYLEW